MRWMFAMCGVVEVTLCKNINNNQNGRCQRLETKVTPKQPTIRNDCDDETPNQPSIATLWI